MNMMFRRSWSLTARRPESGRGKPTAHNCAGFRLRAASAALRANFHPLTSRARHGPRQRESSETPDSLCEMARYEGTQIASITITLPGVCILSYIA
jgi:hypothetical protein